MSELPTGTLTFLFSDIEGSTRALQELGERWTDVLEAHHRVMRAAIDAHGGTEVATEGDSFFAVFPAAIEAIAAAADAQRRLASDDAGPASQVRVRMGLHTGTATIAAGSYTGIDVHRGARIMAAAHGGQVLLSEAARSLAAPKLPEGISVRDLGEHRLRDLPSPERLYQLEIDSLPAAFPPLRNVERAPIALPAQLTSFLGRERELSAVSADLQRRRLLTLTGPGGTGKTRLAIETAARNADRFPGGVWFVPLASIAEPELIAPTIAASLGIAERPGRPTVDLLVEQLEGRDTLLVLDNFEQVVDAAPVVGELLRRTTTLRVLVTSRSLLRISGEGEFPVPPLELPDIRRLPDIGALSRFEAIALFVERASSAMPGFALTDDTARAIAEICVRLDGLPLAIELAAARVRVLPVRAILDRIADRLGLLSGGPRDAAARHRTLHDTIAWSHDLLAPSEQRLFACLSVFVGGAGLGAVERVCGDAVEGELLDAIGSLVDQSLVRRVDAASAREPRFGMLETIREYAVERLVASGRHAELQRGHAEWLAALADELAPRIMTADQREVLDDLELEHDNFRAAINWALEAQQQDVALRLVSRLWRMWQMRGHLAEGMERTRQALALPVDPSASALSALRADALEAAGGLAYWRGDVAETGRWYEEALAARRTLGDASGIAEALYNLSFAFSLVKRDTAAIDLAKAGELAEEAATLFRSVADASGEARALWLLASIDAAVGDFESADARAMRAEEMFRRLEDPFYLGWALWAEGVARMGLNRLDEARSPIAEALRIFAEADDVSGATVLLDSAAILALRNGEQRHAAMLAGAVHAMEATTTLDANALTRAVLQYDPEALRRAEDTGAAWAEGETMGLEAAIQLAMSDLHKPSGALDARVE